MDDDETGQTRILRSQIDELFGRPPLLEGEDRDKYRQLRKQVWEFMDPQNLFDAIETQGVVDSTWEAQRFQRHATKLVDAEHRNALRGLANSRHGYISEEAEEWIEKHAGKPYPDGMTEADFYKKIGLSAELIQAKSVLLAADNFSALCRLATNRIATRKATLKDYARRKRQEAKDKRLAAKAKQQHRKLANDNRSDQNKSH